MLFLRLPSISKQFARIASVGSAVLCCAALYTSPAYSADPPVVDGTNAILDKTESVKDLQYGTVLYEFYQENYFEALKLLHVAKQRGGIKNHGDYPELMEGGISLSYGMDHKAQEIFSRLLDVNTDKPVSAQVTFYLAKVLFERGMMNEAHDVIKGIDQSALPKQIVDEYLFYRHQLFLGVTQTEIARLSSIVEKQQASRNKGKPTKRLQIPEMKMTTPKKSKGEKSPALAESAEVIKDTRSKEEKSLEVLNQLIWVTAESIIKEMDKASVWRYYALYNMAVAYQQQGQSLRGVSVLAEITKGLAEKEELDGELMALNDRVSLASGYMNLHDERYQTAITDFQEVRLDSAYSDLALLGYGWAATKAGNYQLGLSSWSELSKRPRVNKPVLESIVAIPFANEKLGYRGAALRGFEAATQSYKSEIQEIDRVIEQVENGQFIDSFFIGYKVGKVGWFADTPEMPVNLSTRYLSSVVALSQFQEVLKDIQDLMSLRLNVEMWLETTGTYRDILEARKIAHDRFTGADGSQSAYTEKKKLVQSLQADYDSLRKEIDRIAKERDLFAFSNEEEMKNIKLVGETFEILENFVEQPHFSKIGNAEKYRARIERIPRLLYWQAHETFDARLWAVEKQMSIIQSALRETQFSDSGVQKALDITPELNRYGSRISSVESELQNTLSEIDSNIAAHKKNMSSLAIAKLRAQQASIRHYMWQSRLSTVRLYDQSVSEAEMKETQP